MNILEQLIKDYEDLTKSCLHGGLTENDILLGQALEKEIQFWQNQSKSRMVQSIAKEKNLNIIDIKLRKSVTPEDVLGLPRYEESAEKQRNRR